MHYSSFLPPELVGRCQKPQPGPHGLCSSSQHWHRDEFSLGVQSCLHMGAGSSSDFKISSLASCCALRNRNAKAKSIFICDPARQPLLRLQRVGHPVLCADCWGVWTMRTKFQESTPPRTGDSSPLPVYSPFLVLGNSAHVSSHKTF